jgi:predicted phage terminase large subunit-like protein
MIADANAASYRFGLNGGGQFFAVGSGGPLTGRGADLLLIDDPIKPREVAYSTAERRSLQQWFESVAYTRLQPNGAIVLIQTRWHQDDLAGWLLREHAAENWRVVSLPALAEPNDALGRAEGEALWPERYPVEALERIREATGSASWAALYQQRPTLEEGAIFRAAWFKTFSGPPQGTRVIMSIDTAFKAKEASDYSAVCVMGVHDRDHFVLHVSRGRWDFPTLQVQVIELAKIWRPHAVLIEDAASGQSLVQTLQLNSGLPILAVKPQGDKQSRASAVSPLVESGRVYIPAESSWGREFIDEVTAFPAAPHDDQVDSFCQGLAWMRERWTSFDSEAFRESYEAQRRVFGRRPRGWDAPNSMFPPIGAPQHTSIGQNGQSGAPLYGSFEQYDRAEDAAGEPTSWGNVRQVSGGRNRWPGRGRTWRDEYRIEWKFRAELRATDSLWFCLRLKLVAINAQQ